MAAEAEPLRDQDVERFGRDWRMQRFKHALRRRIDLDFAYPVKGLTETFTDPQAMKTTNQVISHLYLDILQEGLPTEKLEASGRLEWLRRRLSTQPKEDLSWVPF